MKSLVYVAPRTLEIQERDLPRAGAGEVVVRIGVTGICGSDMHGFLGHSARRKPGLVLGHETVGTVAETGAGVPESLRGARVAVNPLVSCGRCAACAAGRHNVCDDWRLLGLDATHGAFAEAVAIPARNVHPLPENLPDAAAVMAEPLANAVHLLAHAPVSTGLFPTAAIFGGGTLGLVTLAVARARGIRVVAVSEPNARRAQVARQLGAEQVVDPTRSDVAAEIRGLTGGRGVDLAIDAVGRAVVREAAAASAARGGSVLLLGLDEGPTTLDFLDLIRREIRLQCSFAYTERDFAEALDLLLRGVLDFTPWTEILPLEAGQQAFERLASDPGDRIKIALRP